MIKINSKNLVFKLSVLSVFMFSMTTFAQEMASGEPPKYEVRAVWLTTIGGLDWPHGYAQSPKSIDKQKKELTDILDKLKSANINTVLLQTRIRGTVIYPSALEPWDGCMSGVPGKSPGYDPLAFAVDECHKRGMEIQAWIVAIPAGKWNGLGCRTLRKKHPKLIIKNGKDGFIDPASREAAPYIAGICREIARNYDVDGIHLDYIRYPETFRLKTSGKTARDNITRIVRLVAQEVKAIKPWMKTSCSPIGKFSDLGRYSSHGWNAFSKGCQDARKWLEEGVMDQLYPMMYFKGNQFYPFAMDWKENCQGKTIVPGLGVYFLSPSEGNWQVEEIERQMFVSRANGMGFAFFRNKFFCDDTKGIYTFTKEHFNTYPALVPPVKCERQTKPETPAGINVCVKDGYETISWNRVETGNGNGGVTYNVYASKDYPVNVSDARNLIAQRIERNEISIKGKTGLFYAVTSMNRYGIESSPRMQDVEKQRSSTYTFISNDGNRMSLPDKGKTLDAEYILISSLTGNAITTRPYKGKYADIRNIKDGCYMVYTLNKRDITHKIGFLIIKR